MQPFRRHLGNRFISSDTFGIDTNNSLHAFAHADGGYHLMGCMLSAAEAYSLLWKTIFSNVLGIPLDTIRTEQGPSYGGAILAMVACGEYKNVEEAVRAFVRITGTVYPDKSLTALYNERYERFKKIYPAVKKLYKEII